MWRPRRGQQRLLASGRWEYARCKMRLNLPHYRCVHFELSSEFTVSMDRDDEILSLIHQTHNSPPTADSDGVPRTAIFGSRTKAGGITHRVRGRLTKTPLPTELGIALFVSISRTSDKLRPPPKSIKPVSLLLEASSTLFGPISLSCRTTFQYAQRLGYKSKISLPIPLMIQEDKYGITHIESARFSRRTNDNMEYQIVVQRREASDTFTHIVNFDSTLELSLYSARTLLDKARSISTQLLI